MITHYLSICTSTNDVAMQMAKEGAPSGTVVLAGKQTQGRGRQGRTWLTEEGGLALSMIIRPDLKITQAPRLTFLGAMALFFVFKKIGLDTLIKWPNDILIPIDGTLKKVSGILTEVSCTGEKVDFAIVGVGVNIKNSPAEISNAGFLSEAGYSGDVYELLPLVSESLRECLKTPEEDRLFSNCLDVLREHSATLNRFVKITHNNQFVEGLAIDFDPNGALIVRQKNGVYETLYAGDMLD